MIQMFQSNNKRAKTEICVCFDKDNIDQAYVTCFSIKENRKRNSEIRIHLVHDGDDFSLFDDLNDVGTQLNYIRFADLPKHLRGQGHVSSGMYLRLYLAQLLPRDVKRFIYLDTDIIVNCDLQHLFQIGLEGRAVGAVPDYGLVVGSPLWFGGTWRLAYNEENYTMDRYCEEILKIKSKYYINTGVLLVEKSQWEAVACDAFRFLDNHKLLSYPDQDAISAVLAGRFKSLEPEYNCFSYLYYRDGRSWKQKIFGFAKHIHAIKRRYKKPLIVHFSGIDKPWKNTPATPMEKYWWDIAKKTKLFEKYIDVLGSKDLVNFEKRSV